MLKFHAFIGSDKNAGKTTALLYEYQNLKNTVLPVIITGIGINGENIDNYEGSSKPIIKIYANDYAITTLQNANLVIGFSQIIKYFLPPIYSKPLVLIKLNNTCDVIIEGPNEKWEYLQLKKDLTPVFKAAHLLIDGSIDRQFLISPDISDYLYYALYISNRLPQRIKARALIELFFIKAYLKKLPKIDHNLSFCAFDKNLKLLASDKISPFLSEKLNQLLLDKNKNLSLLYLNGALSKSLAQRIRPLSNLTIVLKDLSLYQNISTQFNPPLKNLFIKNKSNLKKIFLKEDRPLDFKLPKAQEVINLLKIGYLK